jgi:hypothetical protein
MKLLILLLAFSVSAQAEDFTFDKESGQAVPSFIGQLKIIKGDVYKLKQGKQFDVKKGTRFFKGETLVTGPSSFAQILIVDDSILNLSAKSELNFSDFKFVDKTDRKIVYSFLQGQIRGIIKNKAKDGDLIIKTKLAAMSIRGTELYVNHEKVKQLEVSEFALLSGNVLITDNNNLKNELNKSESLVVVSNQQTNKSAHEKRVLSAKELSEIAQENEFLIFFNPKDLVAGSPLYALFNDPTENAISTEAAPPTVNKPNKKNWRNNLKKLNEKLKHYQEN